ncbi:hypothetical protein [Nocardioides sp.]|uniref:hypothetical protein n=1 Tax=Nocardioides sp. TaxID=35761 RepID=UPI0026243007|nr:hypothetical protein [Nocardioides sp.]MDI6912210.1 hypothetical protein [Nocardioides sp.]
MSEEPHNAADDAPTTGEPPKAGAPGAVAAVKASPVRLLINHFATVYALTHHEGTAYAVPRADHGLGPLHGSPGVALEIGGELRHRIVRLSGLVVPGAPITRAVADTVLMHLQARAHEGPEAQLALRFHHDVDEGLVAIDLGWADGRVVTITADGWSVGAAPAGVVFRRSHATKPLPSPSRGGRLVDLAPLLAVDPADEAFRALVGWLVGLPFAASVRPGMLLVGPPGAGKSTRLRLVASILEPSPPSALGSAFGRNFADDQVRGLHRAIPLWDNLTSVSGAVSDELCTLVTGTARETRALYSDNALNVRPIQRPLGLTAVGVPAGLRPDALDRLITLEVPPIEHRIDDAELQAAFDAQHGRLLGAVCDAVAAVLAYVDQVPAPTEHRMAAHARVLAALDEGAAAGHILGCPAGLLAAYAAQSRRVKQRTAAEDTFGAALLTLLEARHGRWSGKASELLLEAGMFATHPDRFGTGWPSSARRIPEVLNHLREGLAALGVHWATSTVRGSTRYSFELVEVEEWPEAGGGLRVIGS